MQKRNVKIMAISNNNGNNNNNENNESQYQ
jgi:hypothetical protein